MKIINSTLSDLDFIFYLYKSAIHYQTKNAFELWPVFSSKLIETDIHENRHWKIMEDETILCIFSVMYNDPVIWGAEKDQEGAVYLHRIAINPIYKGQKMMCVIRDWAMNHAKQNNKKFVRMDTWGNNEKLRKYYIDCGFIYLGQQYLTKVENVPEHYGGSVLSLFEIKI